MSDITLDVVKSGTTVAILEGKRKGLPHDPKIGMTLTIKTTPEFEDFFRTHGGGEQIIVGTQGRHWMPLDRTRELRAWALQTPFEGLLGTEDICQYRLDRIGQPLLLTGEEDEDARVFRDEPRQIAVPKYPNISFMRLSGISDPTGVTFGVRGVFTDDEIRKAVYRLRAGVRRFYEMYLKPVNVAVVMTTQEIPR